MSGAAVGALYALLGRHLEFARICLTAGSWAR
jgi:hypothetical protein